MQESKSISSKSQGQWFEDRATDFYKKQNYQIVSRNKRISKIEVDLILYKEHWVLVEVKSLRHFDEISFRLSYKQKKRLLFARQYFSESKGGESVELRCLFISRQGKFIELSIEDLE